MPVSAVDVDLVYETVLGRAPRDAAERNAWIAQAADIKSLLRGVGLSAEAIAARRASALPFFSYDSDPNLTDEIRQILKLMRPVVRRGKSKIRLGQLNDGGYVMVDDFDNIEGAYSFGISNDVSWDKAVARKGIIVYQFDHTIDKLPEEDKNFRWQKVGIQGDGPRNPELKSLFDVLSANGHLNSDRLILKCDIEGHEIGMINSLKGDELSCFDQIVIEVHFLHNLVDSKFRLSFKSAMQRLCQNHAVVHVHGNNCASMAVLGGIAVPSVLELTLVKRRQDVQFDTSEEVFPGILDMPCDPLKADLYLGNFTF